jgi:hypothetical protein
MMFVLHRILNTAMAVALAIVLTGAPVAAMMKVVLPDPGTVAQWRGEIGTTLEFFVVGRLDGTVWGSGIYTDDSNLATAAVHAGLVTEGQSGIVTVEILKGLDAYEASAQNGVESGAYGPWQGSFGFVGDAQVVSATEVVLSNPGNLTGYRGQEGLELTFEVEGDAEGSVWGTEIYTDDSSLATAAVHAGLIQPGQLGLVRVAVGGPQDSFAGSERNGIASGDYGSFDGSFSFVTETPTGSKIDNN